MLPDENLRFINDAAYPVLTSCSITSAKAMSDVGVPLPPSSHSLDHTRHTNSLPDPSISVDSHEQAWRRLIDHPVPQDELSSLIETIFSDRKAAKAVDRLQGSDVQVFIDVIYGVGCQIVYLQKSY